MPSAQIWPDLTNASTFAWPNANTSSVLLIIVFIPGMGLGFVVVAAMTDLTTSSLTAATVSGVAVMVLLIASVMLATGSSVAGMTSPTASRATLVVEAARVCGFAMGFWFIVVSPSGGRGPPPR